MKINATNNLFEAIYSFARAENLYGRAYWGGDESWDKKDIVNIIDGALATEQAKNAHIKLGGTYQAGVGYIFRWNKNQTRLQGYHMTMLPKTAANIERGSNRYGSGAIRAEL